MVNAILVQENKFVYGCHGCFNILYVNLNLDKWKTYYKYMHIDIVYKEHVLTLMFYFLHF
jgi:hypothetical protein